MNIFLTPSLWIFFAPSLWIFFGTFMMNGRQNMPGAAITTLEVTTCTSFNKGNNNGYNKGYNKGGNKGYKI